MTASILWTLCRYAGTITGISASDPERWPNSAWRSVQVGWDETAASERHERVSPWEIEPFVAVASLPPPSVGPRLKRRPPTLVTDSSPLGKLSLYADQCPRSTDGRSERLFDNCCYANHVKLCVEDMCCPRLLCMYISS